MSRFAGSEEHRDGPETTLVMCNEMIDAMIGAKGYEDAIALFHYYFNECKLIPSIVSFNHIIKVHCYMNRVDKALQLYRHAKDSILENQDSDLDYEDTYRILTKGLVDAGRIYEALGMIKAVSLWDSVAYSYLIRGFLDLGNFHKADELSHEFVRNRPSYPYDFNEIAMVDAEFVDYWFRQGNNEEAMKFYSSIISTKDRKFMCATNFLRIFLKHGKISEAWALFEEMINNAKTREPKYSDEFGRDSFDSETINMMVNECFKIAGRLDEAMDRLKPIGFPNLSSNMCKFSYLSSDVCKPLLEGLLRQGDVEKVNEVLGDVLGSSHVYDDRYDRVAIFSYTYMKYWFEQGKEEKAMDCYSLLQLGKLREATALNALLVLFLKYGKKSEAWSLFNEVSHSKEMNNFDENTLNIMVNECFKIGRFDWAIQIFYKVKASKLKNPDVTCYRNIITRLNKQGILFEAEYLFEEMCSDRLLPPDVSTHTTMIDAYLKAGKTEDALRISNKMVDAFLGQVAWLACL
ncbi:predicted protein [Arabidopsis lyrata subsp. lyrata]|uniref:Predicted protein n=1 Tax=Arabidopsis lyrata subsp. lyrata TaxID=81972 RepID=D7KIP7_ARALL|nr:predicted protein [Arabidopsis lyrata subsp. lyrata]